MRLTYETAPRYATHRAMVDAGESLWERMTSEERNERVAAHLERLWRILEDAHRARLKMQRAERKRAEAMRGALL